MEVLRRGTRGMDAERGAKGKGRPFVTYPRSGTGRREPRRSRGRMSGWPSLWLLSLGQARESDSAGGAETRSVSTLSKRPDLQATSLTTQSCPLGINPHVAPRTRHQRKP